MQDVIVTDLKNLTVTDVNKAVPKLEVKQTVLSCQNNEKWCELVGRKLKKNK